MKLCKLFINLKKSLQTSKYKLYISSNSLIATFTLKIMLLLFLILCIRLHVFFPKQIFKFCL